MVDQTRSESFSETAFTVVFERNSLDRHPHNVSTGVVPGHPCDEV